MKFSTLVIASILFGSINGAYAVGNSQQGETKSASCKACHGTQGVSGNPMWPNLNGQKDQYLIKQLNAFKTGERKDPMMTPLSSTLSEQDIQDLAAYYSSLK